MRRCCERTLVGESRDLLGYYRVLFHTGARSAHAIQQRFGDHLVDNRDKVTYARINAKFNIANEHLMNLQEKNINQDSSLVFRILICGIILVSRKIDT